MSRPYAPAPQASRDQQGLYVEGLLEGPESSLPEDHYDALARVP
jgi:hypothetical protein